MLADQVTCIDRNARHMRVAGRASKDVAANARARMAALLGMEGRGIY